MLRSFTLIAKDDHITVSVKFIAVKVGWQELAQYSVCLS